MDVNIFCVLDYDYVLETGHWSWPKMTNDNLLVAESHYLGQLGDFVLIYWYHFSTSYFLIRPATNKGQK